MDSLNQSDNLDATAAHNHGDDDFYQHPDDHDGSEYDNAYDGDEHYGGSPYDGEGRRGGPPEGADVDSSLGDGDDDAERLLAKLEELEGYAFPKLSDPEEDTTGRAAYIEACKRLDGGRDVVLTFPVEAVLDKMDKEELVLDHVGLRDRGAEALSEALMVAHHVTTLSLAHNHIGPSGAEHILAACLHSKNITILDLSNNVLGRNAALSPEGGIGYMLKQFITRNNTVVQLYLQGNAIGDSDATQIAEAVVSNHTLQKLDLSYNNLHYRGAQAVASMLHNSYELTDVNLSWNRFQSSGCLVILKEGLLQNNTIKTFGLAWNGLDDEGAALIGKIIQENAIEEIDISHNRVTPVGADKIAAGIVGSSSLVSLNLDDNPLRDEGCAVIIRSLRDNSTVQSVRLLQTGCGRKALEEATQTLRQRQNIELLVPERIALA